MSGARSLPAERRLKSASEFQRVYREGEVIADATLVIHALRSPDGTTKLGLSIAKKVGDAPCRNYWKRLIREAFRLSWTDYSATEIWFVVRPKKGAKPEFHAIDASLKQLVSRANRRLPRKPAPPNG